MMIFKYVYTPWKLLFSLAWFSLFRLTMSLALLLMREVPLLILSLAFGNRVANVRLNLEVITCRNKT